MYKYETHLHTYPVSGCAHCSVRENLEFYKEMGYDGVFITNHFLDGNINIDSNKSYKDKLDFYFSDYEKGVEIGKEIGIKVFLGVEMSYRGTDFLIYGLDKSWYYENPQIMDMKKSDELRYLMKNGAYVVQAHPYREANYIDHIRLFPRCVNAVEIINGNQDNFMNDMAKIYAKHYGLKVTAGSDNHRGGKVQVLAGMMSERPIKDEQDFIECVENETLQIFEMENNI